MACLSADEVDTPPSDPQDKLHLLKIIKNIERKYQYISILEIKKKLPRTNGLCTGRTRTLTPKSSSPLSNLETWSLNQTMDWLCGSMAWDPVDPGFGGQRRRNGGKRRRPGSSPAGQDKRRLSSGVGLNRDDIKTTPSGPKYKCFDRVQYSLHTELNEWIYPLNYVYIHPYVVLIKISRKTYYLGTEGVICINIQAQKLFLMDDYNST